MKWFWLLLFLLGGTAEASVVSLEWDANTESDLAGYRLFRSTSPLIASSTQAAMGRAAVVKTTHVSTTTATVLIPSGATFYFRLTAYDTNFNQSGFNVNDVGGEHEVPIFIKSGDVNDDNRISLSDLGLLLRDWSTTRPQADINNSGRVDLSDLSILLANWGR